MAMLCRACESLGSRFIFTEICNNGEYSKVEGDCTRYLHCIFGKFEEFPCSAGLHWNEVLIPSKKTVYFNSYFMPAAKVKSSTVTENANVCSNVSSIMAAAHKFI